MQDLFQLYELIVKRSPIAIVVTRGTGPLFYNRAYFDLLGYEFEEGYKFEVPFVNVHPDDREMVRDYNRRRLSGEEVPSIYEIRMVRKDGEVIDVEVNASVIIYQGEPAALAFLRDVSQRKKVEQALKASEEKYRHVVENAKEAIFVVQDERIRFCNKSTMELSGASLEELTTRPFVDFIHPDDRQMVYTNYQKRIRGEEVPGTYEFRLVDKEGNVKWVELNVVRVEWEGRSSTLNFIHEITEHKELERRIFSERKMEAIGTLAGGMAHDFNNILMGIMGHTSLMLFDMGTSHPHYGRLKAIESQVMAGSELTKQLLGYARAGHYELAAIDLNEVLRATVRLFGQMRKQVKLRQNYYPLLWPVEAGREQIEEVFRQVFLNAWQAMPQGGTLTINTENVEMEEKNIGAFRIPAGKYVHVVISDTGVGMDEEVRARIFEPYFTTREMGRGVGLGLAAVYGIIKGHKGFIDVQSEKGKGTSFHIYLPAHHDASTVPDHLTGGEEKKIVLLIEDEKTVAEVTRVMLNQLGLDVLTASSGTEGLEMFKENHPHLVILVMVMRGMQGEEIFRRLREMDKDVKVLLASGYAEETEVKHLLKERNVGFIQKPYRLEDLQRKIFELLER